MPGLNLLFQRIHIIISKTERAFYSEVIVSLLLEEGLVVDSLMIKAELGSPCLVDCRHDT